MDEAQEQRIAPPDEQRSPLGRGLRYIRGHGFLLILIFLVVYLAFLSENNLVSILTAKRRIAKLEAKCEYYRDKNAEDRLRLEQLRTDNVNLEKYAREQFYMHREGEEIYVVER